MSMKKVVEPFQLFQIYFTLIKIVIKPNDAFKKYLFRLL